ncbi:tripartite tricarboxylate transporter substrate binding protein [Roseomonas eburnea]|uniref:Tripartite tricarboxylate transporter substrate binding protein n=1 Tax=Neoroseomonas eburnea TaxID=1346889 RepID=A0A9X9X9V2_9PROT|nr:tripartite tricarboxylate transporter substrate binding protein [Neoroseomonas eburnea]MBR0680488.1 tripartite tricarboxylate transporter substrate binding protein [Neoroseomonas eburnea]
MWTTRRAALAATMLPMAAHAQAPSWPTRPVRFIVPYPPGGPTDIMGRIVAQAVQGPLGQPFVVENRAGANGIIGSEQVARAAPDGATFLVNASAHTIVPHLTRQMPFDVINDFLPVTNIAAVPLMVVVNPSLPVRSIAELIAYAKANPGRLAYASSSQGGAPHLAAELFKLMAGVDMTHVPYRGSGPAVQDMIAGTVQVMIDSMPSSAGAVRDGRLRALAVTTPARVPAFPDLPTVAEAGLPGYEIATWYGIWAPRGTPQPIVDRLQQATAAAVATPEVRARLDALGAQPVADTPAAFARFVRSEYERWGRLVHDASIRMD